MNDFQKDTFEYRRSISDNIDELVAYGKAFSKKAPLNQLSLFGTDDIEIKRPDITVNRLSQYELIDQSNKEVDIIGLPITYNEFDDYILIEKTLCNSSLQEAFFCTENGKEMTMLVKVVKIEIRKSKSNNKYAKISVERNGVEIKLYLFGNDWQSVLRGIIVNQIHIARIIYNNDLYSIKKIQLCENIPVDKYIKSISLSMRKDAVSRVNAYVFNSMVLKAKIPIDYIIDSKVYKSILLSSISSKNCLELIDMGCEIKINKIL